MTPLDLSGALRSAQTSDPAAIPDVVSRVARELGAADVVIYLVDFAQQTLEPLPGRSAHADVPQSETVATTMAGRAFIDQNPVTSERPEGIRVWVPVVEGSDRTGVLAVTVPTDTDAVLQTCEELGLFTGYLIATHTRATDLFNLRRRRHSLSIAASMQWDLLPPLVLKTERMAVAGLLEPAYEVAGDCFDYALNGPVFDLGVFDPLGHGKTSALIAALCVGSYRHDRREGQGLEQFHRHLDTFMSEEFPLAFTTGQLARVDIGTGTMTWTNAGHPLPLLIRGGQVIGEMQCAPTLPWGIGSFAGGTPTVTVATEDLEPGDGVLFYTDGMTEAHVSGGEPFGIDRLVDLVNQQPSDRFDPEEVVRRLVRSVLEHQDDRLDDDATVVLFQWHGAVVA